MNSSTHIVPLFAVGMGEGIMRDVRDGIHCRSIGSVGKLEWIDCVRDGGADVSATGR